MTELPTGIVTFLFTDIEGSTALWERDPQAMRQSLERHNAILQAAITRQLGITFKLVGDAFHVAFADPHSAIQAAIEIQRELTRTTWETSENLRVRMGLHTGPAEVQDNEYVSHTLNRASRVISAAHGGQILITSAVADQVGKHLPEGASLRNLGQHYLKGMQHPEHLYQVLAPGLRADFPTLNVFNQSPNNLPLKLTSFIGRENEIEIIERLLQNGRLITLTGSGGVGKTRLAIEVGRRAIPIFSDGVWLVELASLTDPHMIPQALAEILGIQETQDRPLMDALKDYLYNKRSLLIIDNCEHMIEACAYTVDTLLNACVKLTILATSREALGLAGEQTMLVPSLSLPVDGELSLEHLAKYEAIQLFSERTQAGLPGFKLTEDNLEDVVLICRRLDGIPLAIELAAARVKTLSVAQIAQRLSDSFRLLTGGSRNTLPRQQTLRATIDWSYRLLTQDERLLLQRLSVFSGGCTLEAAEAVCTGATIQVHEILDLLTSLVNKSMATVDRQETTEPHFRLLETVRQFAREKLYEADEIAAYRDRHLYYFMEWAEIADPETRGPEQAAWLERMDQEYENLISALEWASDRDAGAGLRLASALWWFMWMRNKSQECVRWISSFLNGPNNGGRNIQRGNALGRLGFFFMMHPKHVSRAEEIISESLAINRELRNQSGEAFTLLMLGYLHYYRKSDYDAAHTDFEQSMALYKDMDDLWGLGRNFYNLGNMEGHLGHTLSQRDHLEKSLAICRRAGDLRGMAIALDNLAAVRAEVECDLRGGRRMVEEAIEIYHHLKASGAISNALIVYGHILAWQGEYSYARSTFLDLDDVLHQRGGAIWQAESQGNFGFLERLEGRDEECLAIFEVCLAHINSIDPDHKQYHLELVQILMELGRVLTRQGNVLRAKECLDEALSLADSPLLQAQVRQGLGLLMTVQGNGNLSAEYFQASLQNLNECHYHLYAISAMEDYAGALHLLAQDAKAVQLLGSTAAIRQRIGAPLPPGDQPRYERLLADLRSQMGDIPFDQAWNEGQALAPKKTQGTVLDEVLANVLETLE